MPKRRREYDCTTGSSEINKPQELVDTLEEQFGYSNTTGQGVWSEISKEVASKLSKSVFAIASFHGDEMRCSCSGIVIYWRRDLITLLTSASLVRSFHDESKIDEDLTIKVWNQHYQYVDGWLEQYDLHYNIALVNIPSTSFLCPANLHHQIQLESGSKVVAVGCLFNSRKLMATSGIVMDKVSRFGSEEFLISTCKISKAGTGRPLVDFNGNFLGMNLYDAEQTTVLRRNIIIKFLERLGIFQPQHKQGGRRTSDIMVRSTNNGVYLSTNSHFDPLGVQGELMKGDLFVRANFLCSRICTYFSKALLPMQPCRCGHVIQIIDGSHISHVCNRGTLIRLQSTRPSLIRRSISACHSRLYT